MDSDPVKVKYRYNTAHNEGADGGRYGIEGSLVAWRNYIMGIDNAGMLQCIDLNTMSLVYANNLDDDSDVTMVLEEDPGSGTFYLYTGCEYDDDVRDLGETGEVYVRKLNGLTGEVIWEKPFTAISPENELDGGFLASPILGKEGTTLEGLVIFNGTRLYEDGTKKSKLIAFDKETSDIVWEYDLGITGWSPSSPVPVYSETTDENGKAVGYIVHCEYGGNVELFRVDGDGCTSVSKINMSEELGTTESNNFEATPAVYGNMIVVGSRSGHIFFIKIK
jgi:outer membrane protein assembly factor BamB